MKATTPQGAIAPATPAQGVVATPVTSSGISLTPSDLRTIARKAADYITFNCDGVSEGFEIIHNGYMVFIDYRNDGHTEAVAVVDVWDQFGIEYSDIAEALQMMLN